jgi:HSP20 family protein
MKGNQIMTLIRYNYPKATWPAFRRFPSLRHELDRFFEGPFGELARASQFLNLWTPAVDLLETDNEYVVKAEVPGLKIEEIGVSVHDNALVITGERKSDDKGEATVLHRSERLAGKFERVVQLPKPVAADKVSATYKDGILTVTLPKTEEAKPKQIKINVN